MFARRFVDMIEYIGRDISANTALGRSIWGGSSYITYTVGFSEVVRKVKKNLCCIRLGPATVQA